MASAADVIARDYVMAYALTTIPQEPAMLEMTRCVHPRRIATEGFHSLAVPVHRGSTVVFDDALAYAQRAARGPTGYTYGLQRTPTSRTLEAQLADLDNARHGLVPAR